MKKSTHSAKYRVLLALLQDARTRAGVTQAQLAKTLRTTQSTICKVEQGERRLDVVELHSWCNGLDVSFKKFTEELECRLDAAH